MIEGVFDDSIFDEAAFQVDEIEEFQAAAREGVELAFVQDHGPLTLLPHEITARRILWVKVLRDWVKARREKRERDEITLLAMFAVMPYEQAA